MGRARTIRTGKLGRKELRLVEQNGRYSGLADGKVCVDGDDADDVWRQLHDEAGRSHPRYFGFDDARKRFLRLFPGGFHSEAYAVKERDHKLAAKKRLEETAPLEEAAEGTSYGEAVLNVFRATGMFSRFELAPLQDALHGTGADDFIRAAARFTLKPGQAELLAMREALGDAAKWTVVTYLPFLWRPERHMFLKPEALKEFSVRVGHRFADDYETQLRLPVYDSLLDLVSRSERELEELRPRDRFDVQSFIWIVAKYQEGDGVS